ncbi:diguanylate cyclase [Cohnella sp. REN36]|uniref:GGDEF domain-containing protein n=1 Tax=Cohnella sp. REN36 TaxID=2887347 RepID=UPI001D1563B4|nr:GGDEF domain-containing protein [Cohnella sp. REN36]MCC3377085.1 GGDEF domain-containing protein [Cohnella sp. REN36]
MLFPSLDLNQQRWNRLLLNFFWIVLAMSVVIEALYLTVTSGRTSTFIWLYMARPGLLLALIIGLAEAGVRHLPRFHDYLLITASTLIAVTITGVHATLSYIPFSLFFPILVSTFYFQFKKLLFALACALTGMVLLYGLVKTLQHSLSAIDLVTMAIFMTAYSGIAMGVLMRGRELHRHLRSSYEQHRELLVHTVVMDKLAKTDALTDTYNHMAFHEYLARLTEQAAYGLPLQLAIMDIDNFKAVNDTFGHRAGDEVLRSVAGVVRGHASEFDIVARYGGEEIAVLFTDRTLASAYESVEEIRTAVSAAKHEALGGRSVTISVGLAAYVEEMDKETLFRSADAALYQAKHGGKNRTVVAPLTASTTKSSPA